MSRSIMFYSAEEVRRILRKEAAELCKRLSPIAVEIEIIEVLRNIRIFVKCIDIDDDRIDKLIKRKA